MALQGPSLEAGTQRELTFMIFRVSSLAFLVLMHSPLTPPRAPSTLWSGTWCACFSVEWSAPAAPTALENFNASPAQGAPLETRRAPSVPRAQGCVQRVTFAPRGPLTQNFVQQAISAYRGPPQASPALLGPIHSQERAPVSSAFRAFLQARPGAGSAGSIAPSGPFGRATGG